MADRGLDEFKVDITLDLKAGKASQGVHQLAEKLGKIDRTIKRQTQLFNKTALEGKKAFWKIGRATQTATKNLNDFRRQQVAVINQFRAINRIARVGVATGRGIGGIGKGLSGGLGHYAIGAAKYGAIGAAYGTGRAVTGLAKSSIGLNQTFETGQSAVAATLQLFDHSKGSATQFADNIKVAKEEFEELFKIAARSPATLEETQTLYKNLLPGAISATHDMGRIRKMVENALAIGMINYGDYATTGSQLSRILSGGAGAEQETWRALLSHGILEEGKKAGAFDKNQRKGKHLTSAFNALDEQMRLQLVESTLKRMDPVVEYLSETFAGLTSRVQGAGEILRRTFGQETFDVVKKRLSKWVQDEKWEIGPDGKKRMVQEAGFLNPDSDRMRRLGQATRWAGHGLGLAVDKILETIADNIIWLADNWEYAAQRLVTAADHLWEAAKLFIKYQVTRTVVGGAVQGVGGGIGLVSKGLSGASNLATSAAQMGATAGMITKGGLAMAAAAAIGASALAGLTIAFAGVVAFWVENWEKVMNGLTSGAISLAPLLQMFDLLWNKLVAVGEVWMGTNNIIDSSNNIVKMMSSGMLSLINTFEVFLRILGYVDIGLEMVALVFDTFLMALQAFTLGVLGIAKTITFGESDTINTAFDEVAARMSETAAEMKQDWTDITDNRILKMADAFEAAGFSTGESFAEGMQKAISMYAWENSTAGKLHRQTMDIMNQGVKKAYDDAANKNKQPPGKNITNIDKVIINQHLRNQDPDRIVSAFWRDLHKKTNKRTAAYPTIPGRG